MKTPLSPLQFRLEVLNVAIVADMTVCMLSLHVRSFGVCAYSYSYTRVLVFSQLGDYISDIASNMMLVEEHILWMAQNEARACTRIVQCVERIADLALTGDNQVISKV